MQLVARDFDGMHHREQRVAILLQLRTLVAVVRILHGKRMQPELALQVVQLLGKRVEQRHPDEAFGLVQVAVDVFLGDVGKFPAVLIDDAVDEHEGLLLRQ